MHSNARRKLVRGLWTALPFLVALIPLWASGIAGLPLPWRLLLQAFAPTAAAYHILTHPSRLPVLYCVCLGCVQDVIGFQPFGAGALAWVTLYIAATALRHRIAPEVFIVYWMLATASIAAMECAEIFTGLMFQPGGIAVALFSRKALMAMLLYPLAHEMLHALDRACWRRWWPLLRNY